MPTWLRTTVILVLLGTWTAYITVQLIRESEIDSIIWGIPGGFLLLLGPNLRGNGNGGRQQK
jgi:hypothetical protein